MMFDMFDGQVARLAKVTSDFGAQLDSLCVVARRRGAGHFDGQDVPSVCEVHREASWIIAARVRLLGRTAAGPLQCENARGR